MLKKLGLNVCGDIGCYTLGALAPLQSIDFCVCMGASIGMAHGIEKSGNTDFANKTEVQKQNRKTYCIRLCGIFLGVYGDRQTGRGRSLGNGYNRFGFAELWII